MPTRLLAHALFLSHLVSVLIMWNAFQSVIVTQMHRERSAGHKTGPAMATKAVGLAF